KLILDILGKLRELEIDPEMVDLDGMALMNLDRYIQTAPGADSKEDNLILDIGAAKTVCCILHEGKPVFVRTILWGGDDINRVIREQCGGSAEDAEEWKRQGGLRDEGISRLSEKGVSKAVKAALEPFTLELQRTIHLYSIQQGGRNKNGNQSPGLKQFTLCGGGGKLRGLEGYLGEALELSPAGLNPPPGPGTEAWDPEFAVGLGLALKGARQSGSSRMNFLKSEFSRSGETESVGRKGAVLWVLGFLVAGAAAVDLYMKHDIKAQRYEQVKTEVESRFRTIFPDVQRVVDPVQQARTKVEELEKRSEFLGVGTPSPLELMAEVTRRMPPGIKVEVFDLLIEKTGLRFEAETDKFDSVEKIKAAMEEYEGFGEVKVSDAKVSADQAKVRFRMTINYPTEN
ncbi:MAG TPA: pilus assembly protein PilM, partial [Nitrospiria bacterium]